MGESEVTRILKPAGSVLFGRYMISQLSYEMNLLGIKRPAVATLPGTVKKARRILRKLTPVISGNILLTTGDVPEENDFLILAGGKALSDLHAEDKRPKALIPLNDEQLKELNEVSSDFIVIDRSLISDHTIIEGFMREFAFAISGGLAHLPTDLSIPESFTFSCRTTVYSSNTALGELNTLLKKQGIHHPLILTDKGIRAAGLLEKLTGELESFKGEYKIFDDIPTDSDTGVIDRISREYRERNHDGLIAFGGGSVLDTGKGVCLNVSLGSDNIHQWEGSNCIPHLDTALIAIPTTSGTGSEVTKVAVISDKATGRKVPFVSTNLQPDYGILDNRLTVTLPAHISAFTGMDALSHAIEAFTCLGKNPLSDQMAWAAVEMIRDHLVPAVKDPENLHHRESLALASNLAGQAFSNSMVGMVHTIGHSAGAICHVPHGVCMAILLPPSMEYNFSKIEALLLQLLPALIGEEEAAEVAVDQKAQESISAVRRLNRTLREVTSGRHPEMFRDVKNSNGESQVSRDDFKKIARTALGDASIIYNPEELRFDDILRVLEKSW